MRFALVGTEKDGIELASALVATGTHQMLWVVPAAADTSSSWPEGVKTVQDIEEVLADPDVEAVLIASSLGNRAIHLRRALQSERIVLCLHPADTRPDAAYEAGMLEQDTGQLLLPILPDSFHPGIVRLRELLRAGHLVLRCEDRERIVARSLVRQNAEEAGASRVLANEATTDIQVLPQRCSQPVLERSQSPIGELLLIEVERHSTGEVLTGTDVPGAPPCVQGWDVLRALGGEIAEVSALAPGEEVEPGTPLVLSGRFEHRGLFQATLIPNRQESRLRIRVTGTLSHAELVFPLGIPGPAFLSWIEDGEEREQNWDAWDPWPEMVRIVEEVVETIGGRRPTRDAELPLSWQDAIRCLELDDAVRRSVERRRVGQMEYPEASEEVTFKGTMTLVGCALLWCIIFLAVLSRWVPWLGWAVGPVLGVFLVLQLLRWIIPPREKKT